MVCFCLSTKAQSCKISGANDGSTIEIKSCYLNEDKVIVNVINDSKDISANVTVSVIVTYKYSTATKKQSYSGKEISFAETTTMIEIPIDKNYSADNRFVATSVEATSVLGEKCK